MSPTAIWTIAGIAWLAVVYLFVRFPAINPPDEDESFVSRRTPRDWRPKCNRCGQRYDIQPCCEGPCEHEADRGTLCDLCETREYHDMMNSPCEHGSTVGQCNQCYIDDLKEVE